MTNGPSAGLKNTASEYGAVTKFLHWAIFVLFMHQFVVGFVMTVISEDGSAFGQSREWLFEEHKSIGMVVLLLVAVRIVWRRVVRLPDWSPALGERGRRFEHRLEQLLYLVMVVKPVSGYVLAMADGQGIDFFFAVQVQDVVGESAGVADIALIFHIVSGVLFLVVWPLHMGLMLWHQLRKRDGQLNRMLPFTRQDAAGSERQAG